MLIISNEEGLKSLALQDKDKDNVYRSYLRYKEKTIRFTYTYRANISVAYDSIIEVYKVNIQYKEYLKRNKDVVLSMFSIAGKKNIRTLIFVMDLMEQIYDVVVKECEQKYQQKILKTLLLMIIVYAVGNKQSVEEKELLTIKETFSLDTGSWLTNMLPAQKEETKLSYASQILEQYADYAEDMERLPFLINYIITGALNEEHLTDFIKLRVQKYQVMEGTPAGQVYFKLKDMATIQDEDILPTISEMMEYVQNGKYGLLELLEVYSVLLKYDYHRIMGFKISADIEKKFESAIHKCECTHIYQEAFDVHAPMWDSASPVVYKYEKMKKLASEINDNVYKRNHQQDLSLFVETAKQGDVAAINKFYANRENLLSLRGLDWCEICSVIEHRDNPAVCALINCIVILLSNDYSTYSDEDTNALRDVCKWIEDYTSKYPGKIRNVYLQDLYGILKKKIG